MPEGMFKDVLLYKLGDVFPGANQARIKPLLASCLSTTQRVQAHAADTLSTWAQPQPCSQHGAIAGKIKAKRRMKLPCRRGMACFVFFYSKEKARMVRVCLCLFG